MDNLQQRFQRIFFRGGFPFTILLIAVSVAGFFSAAILQARDPFFHLIFFGEEWPRHVWTLLTWPLIGGGHPIWLLFTCAWAYWICGSLERSWGTRTFAGFFFGMAALLAFSVWAGGRLLGLPVAMGGLMNALAAPTVAWCVINRRESVCFWGVLNIPAPLLGWLVVVLLWYDVGPPVLGLFALTACAAAYGYALHGRYVHRGYASSGGYFGGRQGGKPVLRLVETDRESRRSWSPLARWRARREQRALEALWRRSDRADDQNTEGGGK